jgi:hypothetical protein
MLGERLAASRPDLVVIDHAQMGWLLPFDGAAPPVALLAHNVEHELYGEAGTRGSGAMGWLNRREARLMKSFESRLAGGVDRVWTLTESDAATLERLGAGAVRAFPLPPTVAALELESEPERDVGILGTWTWDANAIGLRWFLDEVHPLLPPSVSVAIAGTASERFATEPGIAGLGRVEDAASFLRSSRVVAVPSVAGGGLQIKTLDAIAGGSAVVATPTAMRGIDDPPPSVRVAEDPAAFAAAIEGLLRSPPRPGDRATARAWVRRRRDLFRSSLDDELTAAIRA